jgi:hypothetical protein
MIYLIPKAGVTKGDWRIRDDPRKYQIPERKSNVISVQIAVIPNQHWALAAEAE